MINVVGDHKKKNQKRKTIAPSQITNFLGNHKPYSKSDLAQLTFLEDLVLYI